MDQFSDQNDPRIRSPSSPYLLGHDLHSVMYNVLYYTLIFVSHRYTYTELNTIIL